MIGVILGYFQLGYFQLHFINFLLRSIKLSLAVAFYQEKLEISRKTRNFLLRSIKLAISSAC